jgi:hypothetical protein
MRCTILSPNRAPIACFLIGFSGSSGSASTPVEYIAIIGLFAEIRVLIRKKPVNLAGFCWSLFLAHISGSLLTGTVCKHPWLPTIATTSEKWVFYEGLSGFFSGWEQFRFAGVRVQILPGKNFLIFLANTKIFSGVSVSRQKFLELF